LKSKSMKQATRWCATAGTMAACGVLLSLLAGCGAQYRPVVSAISPVGPAGQPSGEFAVVLANTGPTSAGLLTFVDVSGDTVVSTPSVLTNPSLTLPLAFTDTESGGVGYTTNLAGSLDVFPQTNPQALLTRDITPTTLPANAAVTAMTALSTPGGLSSALFTVEPSLTLWVRTVQHVPMHSATALPARRLRLNSPLRSRRFPTHSPPAIILSTV
jgi:hypothetical protein